MSYLLFVDESGQDQRESPNEVLAGLAVEDRRLWNLITAIQQAEVRFFGRLYRSPGHELKGTKLLDRRAFKHAAQEEEIEPDEQRELARLAIDDGAAITRRRLTALARAKIAFVEEALILCASHGCRAFASITPRNAPRPSADVLRKDYAYLFERFYYFLEDLAPGGMGLVVFDELDKARSHVLVDQMGRYFRETHTGRIRSSLVVPEPFFVHSDLTTAIQIVDLLAYVIAWGVQVATMPRPTRAEFHGLATLACRLRYRAVRDMLGQPNFVVWSFAYLTDLRARDGRAAEE